MLIVWHFAARKPALSVFFALLGTVNAIMAIINWRNWRKKTMAEKTPMLFWARLQVQEISLPCKREEFEKARIAAKGTMAVTAIAMLYTLCGVLSLFAAKLPLVMRVMGIVIGSFAGWVFWRFGKRWWRQNKLLTCPGCKDVFTTQAENILKTGYCRKCGRQVLGD